MTTVHDYVIVPADMANCALTLISARPRSGGSRLVVCTKKSVYGPWCHAQRLYALAYVTLYALRSGIPSENRPHVELIENFRCSQRWHIRLHKPSARACIVEQADISIRT